MLVSWTASFSLFAARGRGAGRLIAGLLRGDPVAWGILIVVILCFAGYWGYQAMANSEDNDYE